MPKLMKYGKRKIDWPKKENKSKSKNNPIIKETNPLHYILIKNYFIWKYFITQSTK